MKIYIDVSVLTLATFITGIQRVTREIIVRLIKESGFEVVLLHYNAAHNIYCQIDNVAFVNYYVYNQGIKEKMITKHKIPLDQIERGSIFFDLDAAWMCRMKRSYLLPILKSQGVKIVAHIYDIISITHPQFCLERGVYNFMDFIGAHIQYADKLIVNAQATVDELRRLTSGIGCELPSCSVVPLGADFKDNKAIADEEVSKQLADIAKEKKYILMVGTIEPRKNHKFLLDAYDHGLKKLGYNIILAGYMGWNMEAFEKRLKEHPDYGRGIYHLIGLKDKEIAYLYQHAEMLAFLSYTEGFGLPIIEAMQRGTPVLASDIPVLREVGGECCLWVEQDNVEDLCEKVKMHLQNGDPIIYSPKIPILNWEECKDKIVGVLKQNF